MTLIPAAEWTLVNRNLNEPVGRHGRSGAETCKGHKAIVIGRDHIESNEQE